MSLRINGEWIEKEDGAQITDYESVKGGISSAFKRVASSGWGVGRYLYGVENKWYPISEAGKGYDFTINPTIGVTLEDSIEGEEPKGNDAKARMFKITFGKYSGKTLEEIYKSDSRYFQYLIDKSQDQDLVNACKYLKNKEDNH